ncbi:sterol desaturase family protein [Leptospira inadai]|uniref:Sterol desaturase family protein n=1 Tax=Leptospira inadai serovar Lyme TaxID=293084 RepID=A0ABX4YHN5_9LEPT|nr:sterol desaturase family protein [Leptospira inadai]PNV74786.1 sterol desaturase family protein [Leptospira inadai serovar Lyme]
MRFTCELSWDCVGGFALYQLMMNFVRYYPIAGIAFLVFWVWKKGYFQRFRIQPAFPKKERLVFEIKQSAVTLFIFCAISVTVFTLSRLGYLQKKVYYDFSLYGGWFYAIFTYIVITIWHETWFYWMHRLVHLRSIYPYVHSVHHKSVNPSPLAAYNFHWAEAFLEGVYIVPIICFLPVYFYVVLFHTFYAMIMNIWWHLGYELFPKGWASHPILKWINTSSHHNMHHQKFHGNYSLYFNFWDRIMGTNFPDYESYYESVIRKRNDADESESPLKISTVRGIT